MSSKVAIRLCQDQDIKSLYALAKQINKPVEADYFEHCLMLQSQKKRDNYIISYDGVDAGFGILNWVPKYAPFKRLNIPEIQDLNIIPKMRRRGLATTLIQHCEDVAKDKGFEDMGIAFGLHNTYGAAQRLYVQLGYVPDGEGATYDRKQIAFGDFKPVDDDLCLMLIKPL